jgi:hypothetical protein
MTSLLHRFPGIRRSSATSSSASSTTCRLTRRRVTIAENYVGLPLEDE